MKLFIKNMVSLRCKMLVKAELENLGLHSTLIELGEVEINEEITAETQKKLQAVLLKSGLEIIDDNRAMLIERIKNAIIEMVHYSDDLPKTTFSEYLAEKLGYDYTYMSNIFSEVKGITIECFIIIHKIERVKELIIYDELSLTEIAFKLHYSSVGHLSNQFKKTTGLTPTYFKLLKQRRRKTLDLV